MLVVSLSRLWARTLLAGLSFGFLLIAPLGGATDSGRLALRFDKVRVAEVLRLYEALTGRWVFVSADLDGRLVSINSPGELPPNEAAALIASRLAGNYGIDLIEIGDDRMLAVPRQRKEADLATLTAPVAREGSPESLHAEAPVVIPPPAPAPEDYYRGAAGLSGDSLKKRLRQITGNHTVYKYSATLDLVKSIHEDPANPDNVILVYSRRSAPKDDYHRQGSETMWDREHVLPKSYGAQSKRISTSDLHNLFPSIIANNSARGNLYFDRSDRGAIVPPLAPESSHDLDSWEPPDEIKGDIARVIFYMDARYDGTDTPTDIALGDEVDASEGVFGKLSTLLEWHRLDPVSDDERRRNDRIFAIQGNRNPFVDRPEFVEAVYLDGMD